MQGLYDQALKDAEAAEEAEILALVSLTREDPQVTWDQEERGAVVYLARLSGELSGRAGCDCPVGTGLDLYL